MKISAIVEEYHNKYPNKLKIIRKGIFRVLLDHEAFFVGKYFSMKLTKHDKQHIKVGFPISSQAHRLQQFKEKGLGYVLIDKVSNDSLQPYQVIDEQK
jgi:hypothetical protein